MARRASPDPLAAVGVDVPTVARTLLPILAFFAGLQLYSYTQPAYVMPPVPAIAEQYASFWTSNPNTILVTFLRIVAGLVLGFAAGVGLGVGMGLNERVREYGETFVKFLTGIPGLSWVLFALFWFDSIEVRIVFVLFMVLFPWYALSTMDAIRGIPRDFTNMVRSFRFGRPAFVRKLVIPYILPDIVAVSKTNIGYATRVVIVAELVGAATGIGKQMTVARANFEITAIFAWTFVLVTLMLALQGLLVVAERRLLAWRDVGGDTA